MKKFYTKLTVEAPEWCNKCGRETQWKIDGGRPILAAPCDPLHALMAIRHRAQLLHLSPCNSFSVRGSNGPGVHNYGFNQRSART